MKCLDGSNNVKVYNLTASKNLPDWMNNKKKRRKSKRKSDEDLLQDFDMPDMSTCLGLSDDGQYLMAAGKYKPCVKCFDLSELSLKFERGMDADVIAFKLLANDFSKVVFLQEERYLEFHGQGGRVCRLRIPRFGRDLVLNPFVSELYVAASGNEIYRLNLFQGRFLNSFDANTKGVNKLHFNKHHGFLTCGTDDGHIQVWDPRQRRRAATLDTGKHMIEHANRSEDPLKSESDLRITALEYKGPFTMAVGTQTGLILMYDIRNAQPSFIRDHRVQSPIKALHFHSSGNVFSMAPSVVKIWDQNNGTPVTSFEGDSDFNDMAVVPETGMAFFAAEDKRMKAYFIPSLGPAPSWCAHLDAMTEEMDEDDTSGVAAQFDDFTFVTAEDLTELGLRDLIGSSMLRAVMHGYYISTTTYNKAKQLANPVKPENVVKKKLKETIADQNTMKIKTKKAPVLVNEDLREQIITDHGEDAMMDARVAALFTNKKFARDPEVERKLNKSSGSSQKRKDAFKKRMEEIKRDEEEFEVLPPPKDGQDSDVDSVVDFALEETKDSEDSDEEEEREEQKRKLFRSRSGGNRKRKKSSNP